MTMKELPDKKSLSHAELLVVRSNLVQGTGTCLFLMIMWHTELVHCSYTCLCT